MLFSMSSKAERLVEKCKIAWTSLEDLLWRLWAEPVTSLMATEPHIELEPNTLPEAGTCLEHRRYSPCLIPDFSFPCPFDLWAVSDFMMWNYFYILFFAFSYIKHFYITTKQRAVHCLGRTQAHRCPRLASVAVIDSREIGYAPPTWESDSLPPCVTDGRDVIRTL